MKYHQLPIPSADLELDHYELFRVAVVPVPNSSKIGIVASSVDRKFADVITPTIAGRALAAAAVLFLGEMKPADPVQALDELRKAIDEVFTQPQCVLPPGTTP